MKKHTGAKACTARISAVSASLFIITMALCTVLISFTIINRSSVEKLMMEQLILEKSIQISDVITKLLYKTYTLSALAVQANGEVEDFERLAITIIDDPSILNVLLAPDGVVSYVYPLEGNEAAVGLDFFSEGAGNKEAAMAKETGRLVFGGPFTLVQGGQALVGRLPVYTPSKSGRGEDFWGLASVTLKYPEALNAVGLSTLKTQGFAYEIWRINPDDGQRQIIACSDYEYNEGARFIEKHIPILNADWVCRISPVRNWYEYPETWLLSLVSLLVSLLVAYVAQNNVELKKLELVLEEQARVDSLTGVFNRRNFTEMSEMLHEKATRSNTYCCLIMFDLDYFKKVNDEYGHLAGDATLRTIAQKVKGLVRPYDLLARYGGEEFIIFASDIVEEDAVALAERLRAAIEETVIQYEGFSISVTASFGVALAAPKVALEKAMKQVDNALYIAKNGGRNQVTFYSGDSTIPETPGKATVDI